MAARRAATTSSQPSRGRSHAVPAAAGDPTGATAVLAATRALLSVESRAEARHVLHTAVNDLGGGIVPARLAGANAIPMDVSLGAGEPELVVVSPTSIAAMLLSEHLPQLVQDALRAAAAADTAERLHRRASVDALTGVSSRAEIGPRLGVTREGDAVCLLDLDRLKQLNDGSGHAAGDDALRAFGRLLRDSLRGHDFCGRYGGDEFVVVFPAVAVGVAASRMTVIAHRWAANNPWGLGVSTGVAAVNLDGGAIACAAADRALYRAKDRGRGGVELAVPDDYLRGTE